MAEVEKMKESHVVVAARVARSAFAGESDEVRKMVFEKVEEEKKAKEKAAEAGEMVEAEAGLTPEQYAE